MMNSAMSMLLRPIMQAALEEAALALKRPDAAELIADTFRVIAEGISPTEDHDFRDAPRTKDFVQQHPLPKFSRDADCINALVQWACDLEREIMAKEKV